MQTTTLLLSALCLTATACTSVVHLQHAPAQADASHSGPHPRELFLAGGALRVCSSLSLRDCRDPAPVAGADARGPSRHALDRAGLAAADDPRLWQRQGAQRAPMRQVLAQLQQQLGSAPLEAKVLVAALERECIDNAGRAQACAGDQRAPWSRLDDDGQGAVLAALELPQRAADGSRLRERASLAASLTPHGAEILRAFVAAAQVRAGAARPRIAVVTASAFDPFDPVDFYLDALRQAGADAQWWPLDGALAAAVFDGRGCAALPELRHERLRLPARERVYPDLAAHQALACADPDRLASVPERVHGVFFSGGDQWKLRKAFFDDRERPNAWLQALRAAVARGGVVVGGTSAGSAVQSGGPMLSNGTSTSALRYGAVAAAPPSAGCTRAGDCPRGLDEDAFTYWPAGGLGLAPDIVIDTHFSERARELRLLRLLTDTGARWGIGADETSALHLIWQADGRVQARGLGASGGWVFDAGAACIGDALQASAYYLTPGAVLRFGPGGAAVLSTDSSGLPSPLPAAFPQDALERGALRAAAQALAGGQAKAQLRADAARVELMRSGETRQWTGTNGLAGVSALQLTATPWGRCRR